MPAQPWSGLGRELEESQALRNLWMKPQSPRSPCRCSCLICVRSLTPHPDTQASGAFIGIRSTTTRGAMFRAVLEGLAFEARAIADAMGTVAGLPPFEKILTIGGSLQNSLLAQIKADVYAFPIKLSPVREAVSLGVALLAGLGCGLFPDPSAAVRVAHQKEICVEPNSERSKRLQARYQEIYRDLYGQLRTAHHRLHALGQ